METEKYLVESHMDEGEAVDMNMNMDMPNAEKDEGC